MFLNNLKIAWRSILKNKLFTLINIVGLSIGICASLVIGAIVYYDFSFDNFHKDKELIYRVVTVFNTKEGEWSNRGVAPPLMQTFTEGVPGVQVASPLINTSFHKVKNPEGNLNFKNEEEAVFADGSYFDLLEYEWLAGDKKTALSQPKQVVLSQKKVEKYFPGIPVTAVVGKTLNYNDSIPVQVTGVVADFTENTDFAMTQFMSMSSAEMFGKTNMAKSNAWNSTNSSDMLFLKMQDENSAAMVQSHLDALAAEHKDTSPWAQNNERFFKLEPLSSIHFGGNYNNRAFDFTEHIASLKVLKSLGLVTLFLLLLGGANFINLNSAQALSRAKEIGIRKTLGSSKKQVVRQFLMETVILTTLATLLSLVLAPFLLAQFKDFLPDQISLSVLYGPTGLLGILALILIVSFVSGFYPAFVLSRFKPVLVLKGQLAKGNKGARLRKTLTVFQFAVAQVFVIATLLIAKQLHYVMNKDMGIATNAVAYVYMPWNGNTEAKKNTFFTKVKEIKGLENVSLGGSPPASNNVISTIVNFYNEGQETHHETELLRGDLTYFKTYGIPILAGRDRLNDSIKEYVVNETFAKSLGFQNPAEIIGHSVKQDTINVPIVGLVQDFNQRSLRSTIKPVAISGEWDNLWSKFNAVHFNLGANREEWQSVLEQVKDAWATVYPDEDVDIAFMDEVVASFYRTERSTVQLLEWATGLAILISCLGLLGLVVYSTEKRVKEISVRKVLGANLAQLNFLLCKEFLVLVGVAFVIAVPISWYLLEEWIQGFAYKTDLSWWVFVSSGLGMVIVALVVIGARTYKTANVNPAQSLRAE